MALNAATAADTCPPACCCVPSTAFAILLVPGRCRCSCTARKFDVVAKCRLEDGLAGQGSNSLAAATRVERCASVLVQSLQSDVVVGVLYVLAAILQRGCVGELDDGKEA
jgi:hypothetical protein